MDMLNSPRTSWKDYYLLGVWTSPSRLADGSDVHLTYFVPTAQHQVPYSGDPSCKQDGSFTFMRRHCMFVFFY